VAEGVGKKNLRKNPNEKLQKRGKSTFQAPDKEDNQQNENRCRIGGGEAKTLHRDKRLSSTRISSLGELGLQPGRRGFSWKNN